MNFASIESCEAAADLGWLIGAATGTFAGIVIIALISLAPALGAERAPARPRRKRLLASLRHSLWSVTVIWILGGSLVGGAFASCYAAPLATAAALTIGIVLLLAMLTAANQIGARSVR